MAKMPLGQAKPKTTALRPANAIKMQQNKRDKVLILAGSTETGMDAMVAMGRGW